jgi:hypothetical protein
MRPFLRISLFLVLASSSRAEGPPDEQGGANPDPKKKCEALLKVPRPEEAEAAAAWDKCQPSETGQSVVVPGTGAYEPNSGKMDQTAESALIEARKRVATFNNPFETTSNAGTLTAPDTATGGRRFGADVVPYAGISGVGAGGPARLDQGVIPAPQTRIDQGFAAFETQGPPGSGWLAASAAYRAVLPVQPTAESWTAWARGRTLPGVETAPLGPLNLVTPKNVKEKVIPQFVVTEPVAAPPKIGAGITGTANKNVKDAVPTTNFKAGVDRSVLAAFGATWLHGLTVNATPGDKDKRLTRTVGSRAEFGGGNITGFFEVGVENRYTDKVVGTTPKGKAIHAKGEETTVPFRIGVTRSFSADDR